MTIKVLRTHWKAAGAGLAAGLHAQHGRVGAYRQKCAQVAHDDYLGFRLRAATVASESAAV